MAPDRHYHQLDRKRQEEEEEGKREKREAKERVMQCDGDLNSETDIDTRFNSDVEDNTDVCPDTRYSTRTLLMLELKRR